MKSSHIEIVKTLPVYVLANYLILKLLLVGYIFIHNMRNVEQGYYHIFFNNSSIELSLGTLISPLILAPLFETLFFCVLLYRFFKWLNPRNFFILFIISSACMFSIFHLINEGPRVFTILYTLLGGIIFAHCYKTQYVKYGENKAYLSTSIVHSLANILNILI